MAIRNIEGLTFAEWICATRFAQSFLNYTIHDAGRQKARLLWLAGEDPTEYAEKEPKTK